MAVPSLRSDHRVSVVINTYNRPAYLREALATALGQTYQDFRVLVYNDAGGRDAEDVVRKFADDRLTYHHARENRGALGAQFMGYRAASGEFITHMDDDDFWDERFLERMVGLLDEHPSAAIAFCDHWITGPDGTIDAATTARHSARWRRDVLAPGLHQPARDLVLAGAIPASSGAVWRRDKFDIEPPPAGLLEAGDRWLSYLLLRHGEGAVYTPERLMYVRWHPAQITQAVSSLQGLSDAAALYRRFYEDPAFAEHRPEIRGELAKHEAFWAMALLQHGQVGASRAAARRGARTRLSIATAASLVLTRLPPKLATRAATLIREAAGRYRHWRGMS